MDDEVKEVNKEESNDIWKLYEKGKEYNESIGYYKTIKENDKFVDGDQWDGVKANGLPTPTFNMFKRVINHFIAFLISTPLKIKFISETQDTKLLNALADSHWELDKMDDLIKRILKKAAKTGDMALYTYWDPNISITDLIKGDYVTENIDGCNVMLGNPNKKVINIRGKAYQPYILLVGRETVKKLRAEAKEANRTEDEIRLIVSDEENEYQTNELATKEINDLKETKKATYVIKMWYSNDTKTVHFTKAVKNAVIKENIDIKIPLYPIAWENWDERDNCYHGSALVTGYISAQKFVNKQMSLAMVQTMLSAMPKTIYDNTKIQKLNNQVGATIGVAGPVNDALKQVEGAPVPQSVLEIVKLAMTQTLESMGANDVLLGNIKPDNATAIVQVVEQASTTLLNQQTALYNILEQNAEICYEFAKAFYGDVERPITYTDKEGNLASDKLVMSIYNNSNTRPKIEVGPSKWWSENAIVTTLDLMRQSGIINNLQYLERLPEGYIPKKEELINEIKQQMGLISTPLPNSNGINIPGLDIPGVESSIPVSTEPIAQ